jgi:hypothetical protein
LFFRFAYFIVLGVRSDPADEQMDLFLPEDVFTDHAILIPADIEYDPVTPVSQQIGGAVGAEDVFRLFPIGVPQQRKPDDK